MIVSRHFRAAPRRKKSRHCDGRCRSAAQSRSKRFVHPHIMPEPSYHRPRYSRSGHPDRATISRGTGRGKLSLPGCRIGRTASSAAVGGREVSRCPTPSTGRATNSRCCSCSLLIYLDLGRAANDLAGGRGVALGHPPRNAASDCFGAAPLAAKALVLLGVAQLAANFVMVGTAQMAGIYEIVSGDARVGPHEFHILANGANPGIFRRHHLRRDPGA